MDVVDDNTVKARLYVFVYVYNAFMFLSNFMLSKTVLNKDNATSAGPPETHTWVTTLQSTTPRLVTSDSDRFISTAKLPPWSATTPITLCCEGVLIFAPLPRLPRHTYPVWAPIHAIIQGYLCRQSYLHYGPPFPAQGKVTR
jgi:hypothetical protein